MGRSRTLTDEERLAVLSQETAEELIERGQRLLALGRELFRQSEQLRDSSSPVAPTASQEPEAEVEPQQEEKPAEPARDVGRYGIVNEHTAKIRAAELGEFDMQEFAEKVGLSPLKAMKWLRVLVGAELVVYTGGRYQSLMAPDLRDWIVSQGEMSWTPEEAAEATRMAVEEVREQLENFVNRAMIISVNGNGRFRYLPPPNDAPNTRPHRTPEWKERPCGELSLATGEPVRVAATKRATRRQRSVAGAGGIHGAKAKDRAFERAQQAKQERAEANKTKAQKEPKWKSRSAKRSRPTK